MAGKGIKQKQLAPESMLLNITRGTIPPWRVPSLMEEAHPPQQRHLVGKVALQLVLHPPLNQPTHSRALQHEGHSQTVLPRPVFGWVSSLNPDRTPNVPLGPTYFWIDHTLEILTYYTYALGPALSWAVCFVTSAIRTLLGGGN